VIHAAWQEAITAVISFALLLAAILIWATSLAGVNLRPMNDLGLISVLPPGFFVAAGLLTCSFCLALRSRPVNNPMLLLHVGILILFLYGTPALVEQTPRIAVTWRHIGLIDYVMHNGRFLPKFDAYFNWPGYFALGAFVTQIAGLPSLISLAAWSNVFFNALYLAPLALIYRSTSRNARFVWVGLWFFYLTNWVGQDYFSPQGFDYFLYLALIAILLGWYRSKSVHALPIGMLRNWLRRMMPRAARLAEGYRNDELSMQSSPWQRVGLMAAAIAIYAAMVPSHQLTPFAALVCVGLLVVFNRITPKSLPILMAAMVLSWTSFMAVAYFTGHLNSILSTGGAIDQNVNRGVVDRLRGSPDHMLVVHARLAMTAAVGTLALAGLFRRLIAGYRDVSMALIAVAPVFLGIAQYGGEMFLRVYFFALPALAFFAAALFFPTREGSSVASYRLKLAAQNRRSARPVKLLPLVASPPCAAYDSSWRTPIALGLVSLALVGGFTLTRYGNERMDYFTPQEVQAVRYLYRVAPSGSQFLAPGISVPWQFEDYTSIKTRWIENRVVRNSDVTSLEQTMSKDPNGDYVIVTRSTAATLELYSGMSPDVLPRFEQALRDSGRFTIIYQNPDARIYMFINDPPSVGPR
jgi:hypothetical protein